MAENAILQQQCFSDLRKRDVWGYGIRRIPVLHLGTMKIMFHGFGYKKADGTLHIGLRYYGGKEHPNTRLQAWAPHTDIKSCWRYMATELAAELVSPQQSTSKI